MCDQMQWIYVLFMFIAVIRKLTHTNKQYTVMYIVRVNDKRHQ